MEGVEPRYAPLVISAQQTTAYKKDLRNRDGKLTIGEKDYLIDLIGATPETADVFQLRSNQAYSACIDPSYPVRIGGVNKDLICNACCTGNHCRLTPAGVIMENRILSEICYGLDRHEVPYIRKPITSFGEQIELAPGVLHEAMCKFDLDRSIK